MPNRFFWFATVPADFKCGPYMTRYEAFSTISHQFQGVRCFKYVPTSSPMLFSCVWGSSLGTWPYRHVGIAQWAYRSSGYAPDIPGNGAVSNNAFFTAGGLSMRVTSGSWPASNEFVISGQWAERCVHLPDTTVLNLIGRMLRAFGADDVALPNDAQKVRLFIIADAIDARLDL